ncbi:MAG: ATP-binding cassette domain-containing protein [Alphaproteobacteria bacterium]
MTEQYAAGAKEHWFFGPVFRAKHELFQLILGSVLINIFALVSAFYIMIVYDRVIPNEAIETLYALTIGVMIVVAFDLLMKVLRGLFTDRAGAVVDEEVAATLFDRLSRNEALATQQTGKTASIVKEFDLLRDFLGSATFVAFADLPFVIIFLFVLYSIGGLVVLVPTIIVVTILLLGLLIQPVLRRLTRNAAIDGQSKQAVLVEVLSGMETLKTLRGMDILRHRWMNSVRSQAGFSMKSKFWSQLTSNFSQTGQQLSQVGIVVFGVFLIMEGSLTMGSLIACVILSGRTLAPLGQISNLLGRLNQVLTAYDNLNQLMQQPVTEVERSEYLRIHEVEGNITFSNAGLQYPKQKKPSADDISLAIGAGEKVAVLGRIGSGKTTILRMIAGLVQPTSGMVQVDRTDVSHFHPDDLRKHVSVVMQQPLIFSGTLRQNITLGNPDATDEEIMHVARLTGVDGLASMLPDGFDTMLTERGMQLSGGQRQAICIARALVNPSKILLLDEPTSAMDSNTEMAVMKNIMIAAKDKTVILVTHRGILVDLVERVVVMDSGKIIADGPREEIKQKLRGGGAA